MVGGREVVAVGGQRRTTNERRAPTRALLALTMVLLMGMAMLAGPSGLVGTASAANHAIESCTTITESGEYDLASDLQHAGNNFDPCIDVQANDVTIDGNGYSISGGEEVIVSGIHVDDYDNLTVSDVGVTGFWVGVDVEDAGGVTVQDTTIEDLNDVEGPGVGIYVQESEDFSASGVTVDDAGDGIVLDDVGPSEIRDSSITN